MIGYKNWPMCKGLEIDRNGEAQWIPNPDYKPYSTVITAQFILNPKFKLSNKNVN